ncbi:MAG TPA: hypothetical protein VHP12_09860 [Chitinophagaceae bacterium]|nr:hypothetical protein [Chitinophagaceae bacterium]
MDNGTKAGTAGGTLLTIIINIKSEDVLKTMVLAAVGAVISFAVSFLLKQFIRMLKKK